jgi:Uma2 family endonuclease
MATVLEPKTKRWTYEEYYRLDDDKRYEIINGQLLMPPSPDTWHQDWVRSIFLVLHAHVRAAKLGEMLISPLDVVFDEENLCQPDLIFVAEAQRSIIQKRGIFGSPHLLVEIISPSSVRRDRYDKRALYARFGAKEYWIGDAANRSLEIHTLNGSAYELHCCAEEKGVVTSPLLSGLQFDVSNL